MAAEIALDLATNTDVLVALPPPVTRLPESLLLFHTPDDREKAKAYIFRNYAVFGMLDDYVNIPFFPHALFVGPSVRLVQGADEEEGP